MRHTSINMFVAVVTTVFADVRAAERVKENEAKKRYFEHAKLRETEIRASWEAPCYYVPFLGGPAGPYPESARGDDSVANEPPFHHTRAYTPTLTPGSEANKHLSTFLGKGGCTTDEWDVDALSQLYSELVKGEATLGYGPEGIAKRVVSVAKPVRWPAQPNV
jgi:hypothetical protein